MGRAGDDNRIGAGILCWRRQCYIIKVYKMCDYVHSAGSHTFIVCITRMEDRRDIKIELKWFKGCSRRKWIMMSPKE